MKYRLGGLCPGQRREGKCEDAQGPERPANPHTGRVDTVQAGLGSSPGQVPLRPEEMQTVTPTSAHMVVVKIEGSHVWQHQAQCGAHGTCSTAPFNTPP